MIADKKLSEIFDFSWIDIEEWKKDIGEIPPPTCPAIDKIIKDSEKNTDCLRDINKIVSRYYDDVSELAKDISYCIDYTEIDIEPLREQNQQLRSLGEFWYDKCCEIANELKKHGFVLPEGEDGN